MKPRRLILFSLGVVFLISAVLGLALPATMFGESRLMILELLVPTLLIALVFALRAKVRSMYENQKALLTGVHITVSEAALAANAAGIKSEYAWSAIVRMVTTKELVLLYISKGTALFLARSALNAEQIAMIRDLLPSGAKA